MIHFILISLAFSVLFQSIISLVVEEYCLSHQYSSSSSSGCSFRPLQWSQAIICSSSYASRMPSHELTMLFSNTSSSSSLLLALDTPCSSTQEHRAPSRLSFFARAISHAVYRCRTLCALRPRRVLEVWRACRSRVDSVAARRGRDMRSGRRSGRDRGSEDVGVFYDARGRVG